jgi:hypothetical protein
MLSTLAKPLYYIVLLPLSMCSTARFIIFHGKTKAPPIVRSIVLPRHVHFPSSQPDAANKQYPSVHNHKGTSPVSPAAELGSL